MAVVKNRCETIVFCVLKGECWGGVCDASFRQRKSGLKKTRPFRFVLLKSAVLDWFMVSSCLFWWSFTCQTLAANARNRAKTTKFKSDVLETLVILMPEKNQARKKSTKTNFLGAETARWGGGLPRKGLVAEKFVPSLESLSSLGFEERDLGCPGNFAGMSRISGGVQKVCAKKVRAHFSFLKKDRKATHCEFDHESTEKQPQTFHQTLIPSSLQDPGTKMLRH